MVSSLSCSVRRDDLELQIELAQNEVRLRDIGDQRDVAPRAVHFRCDVIGVGRFRFTPDPAEYIELPGHAEIRQPILETPAGADRLRRIARARHLLRAAAAIEALNCG